jgi:hypothetical protein
MLGAVLGRPARADRERPTTQVVRRRSQQYLALVRRHLAGPDGQHHPVWDADLCRQELPEAGSLAAYVGGIGQAHVLEPSHRRGAQGALLVPAAMAARITQ